MELIIAIFIVAVLLGYSLNRNRESSKQQQYRTNSKHEVDDSAYSHTRSRESSSHTNDSSSHDHDDSYDNDD